MTLKQQIITCIAAAAIGASLLAAVPIAAQGGDRYKARLAPAPPLGLQARSAAVAGIGSAAATLNGRKLTITGSFEKMASAAMAAKLCLGVATGARLDPIYDLTVTKAANATPAGTQGTISGTFDLKPEQVDGLKQGKMYIQINSEGAPNGHLLGWLLK